MALRLTFFKFDLGPSVATSLQLSKETTFREEDLSKYQTVATPYLRDVRTVKNQHGLYTLGRGSGKTRCVVFKGSEKVALAFVTVEHNVFALLLEEKDSHWRLLRISVFEEVVTV